jgi:hypothetical protein
MLMNNNYNRISAIEIRREAHHAFRKDIRGNISLNVIPILLRFLAVFFGTKLYTTWMANLNVNLADPGQTTRRLTEISNDMASNPSSASKYMLTLTPETSVIVYAFMFFFIMVCVGVSYTALEKYRNPDYQVNALRDSLANFFRTILLSNDFYYSIIRTVSRSRLHAVHHSGNLVSDDFLTSLFSL